MAISIELQQTRTVEAEDLFRVRNEVLVAEDIIPEVFVLNTEDDAFLHVAMVNELVRLPRTKQEAEAEQEEHYLSAVASADYVEVATAVYAGEHVLDRVQHLVTTYANYETEFAGQDEHIITPETV